jgi:hypothetical protein
MLKENGEVESNGNAEKLREKIEEKRKKRDLKCSG